MHLLCVGVSLNKCLFRVQHWWLTPVILATQVPEIRFEASVRKYLSGPYLKTTQHKKGWWVVQVVECLPTSVRPWVQTTVPPKTKKRKKYLFRSFGHFKIGFVVFLLFICKSFFYSILNASLLSDVWFANIFSHSVSCLFSPFLMV
jgi:hypothetical protein